jgi:hypothetical protein
MRPDPYTQCVLALEYMATAVHAGDMSALQLAAFVWAQRSDEILAGKESWADQHLPAIRLGGGTVPAHKRTRPVTGGPLSPPSPGDPYLAYDHLGDLEGTRDIVFAAVEAHLAAAGIELDHDHRP